MFLHVISRVFFKAKATKQSCGLYVITQILTWIVLSLYTALS